MISEAPHTTIQTLLGLQYPPVAITFLESLHSIPAHLPAWNGPAVAAGCVFWKKAQEGEVFYTVPADHYNCAVGAYTHNIALPTERAAELEQTIGFMVASHYIALTEVPGIPTLPKAPAAIVYGPVDKISEMGNLVPDLIVLAAKPAQAMLIYEAAIQAGASNAVMSVLGRPGCAILPLVANGHVAALSLGCKGNRTFTGLPDEEMYLAVSGDKWQAISHQLLQVQKANQTLGNYYADRKAAFDTPSVPV